MPSLNVTHNEAEQKFSAQLPEGEAFLRYAKREQCLNFLHTFVPEAGRNQGVAEQVVLAGFEYAKAHELKVIPTCPYVAQAFLRRHPELQSIVSSTC